MKRDLILPAEKFRSSFLSCEKDCNTILRKLFITSQPYSDTLKKLLVINTKDCLDNNSPIYAEKINSMSVAELKNNGYIKLEPKLSILEHDEVKSFIIISFDNFLQSYNNKFRNCTVTFDILSHTDCWDLGNFRLRPLKIAGYIDGILNNTKLSGIGTLNFVSCKQMLLDENLSGYSLTYAATHGEDDLIEGNL